MRRMSAPEQQENAVIEIESDPEEDQRIISQYRQTRLVPDRRLNRPRDAANRFVSAETVHSRLPRGTGENIDGEDDDDLQIVHEVYADDDGPIDGTADFVDLDEYGNQQTSMVINYELPTEENSHRQDDDVTILEERTAQPTFLLNLPSGQTLRISGRAEDRVARRSFDTQRTARAGMLRRAAQGARRLFMSEQDEDATGSVSNDRDYIPQAVLRQRQQALMQERIQRQRRQQLMRQRGSITDPEVEMLDPELRSIFYHAETLHEVRTMLQESSLGVNPATTQHLLQMYMQFRSRQINNWARQRTQNFRGNDSSDSTVVEGRDSPIGSRTRLRTQLPANQQRRNSFTSYVLARSLGGLGIWPHDFFGDNEEEVTQNIIDMIQAREERELDNRKQKYMEDTKSQQQALIDKAQNLPENYYASFDSVPKIRMTIERDGKSEDVVITDDEAAKTHMDIPVCCLCGVELGLGIPNDFEGISQADRGVSFESLVSKYAFHCPYQALARPSVADRDLSKKTFAAHCGHTFCGRCFARINNAKKSSKMSKKRLKELRGPSHPDNYGPRICPAEGCKGQLRSRGRMREIFF